MTSDEPCHAGPWLRRRQFAGAAIAVTAGMPAVRRIGAAVPDDCAAGAAAGPAQMPHLLDGYAARPPWKVAGVDYAVGVPAAAALTDWTALRLPGVTARANAVLIGGAEIVLDGIDFSRHGGASVTIDAAVRATVRNCRFGGASLRGIATGIIDSAARSLIVRNCAFDGAGAGTAACVLFVRAPGHVAFLYNHVTDFPSRVIELLAGGHLDYRFNLIGEGAMQPGAHLNYLEFSAGTAAPVIAFNTTAQTRLAPSGGEGFQFYFNRQGTMVRPVCAYNTMIARGSRGRAVMSYLLHGSGAGAALSGTALAIGNHVDVSSAYGAFYPRSFQGWTVSGNIDMSSGWPVSSQG